MQNNQEQEVLLRVENLCQFFGPTKAVNNVSFDIKKGEVFGLVGESGCGKTTTGRSIIKLYDITSGNIYFKGTRIGAGTLSYRQAIAEARQKLSSATPEEAAKLKKFIKEQQKEIKLAKYDQKHCDKQYARKQVAAVNAKYMPMISKASGDQKAKLVAEYRNELRKAKKTKLVTKIQMIFQDPSASLAIIKVARRIINRIYFVMKHQHPYVNCFVS